MSSPKDLFGAVEAGRRSPEADARAVEKEVHAAQLKRGSALRAWRASEPAPVSSKAEARSLKAEVRLG